MQDRTVKRLADLESIMVALPDELVDTGRRIAGAYPPMPVPDEFRMALRTRLIEEAGRLQREPVTTPRPAFLVPAALGAVAFAGLALLGWRTRAITNLVAHAQDQIRAAQGS